MNFQVGKIYPFVLVEYSTSGPRVAGVSVYLPWQDHLTDLKVTMLECQYADVGPIAGFKYVDHFETPKGYIFKDLLMGHQWLCQTPVHRNMDDSGAFHNNDENFTVREDLPSFGKAPRYMILAEHYLSNVQFVMKRLKEFGAEEFAGQMDAHAKIIVMGLMKKYGHRTIYEEDRMIPGTQRSRVAINAFSTETIEEK